jgi:long-chain acyl-CoA synthetase
MQVLTAPESERIQRRVAGALADAGAGRGDRVVFALPPSGLHLSALLGTLRAGVVPVPLNPALLADERAGLIADAEPALVVDDERQLQALLAGEPTDLAPVPLARPMHYTSGTTGRPKGVWSGVLDEAAAADLLAEEQQLWDFRSDDRTMMFSPMHHSAPLRFAFGTLLAGGSVVIPGPFDPVRMLAAIREHRPTTAFCVPAHLRRLLPAAADHAAGAPDFSSFRLLAHAGSPCPPPVKERAMELFPAGSVWEFYGSTEGQFTACGPDDWRARPGTVGRARPGRRLALDDDGQIWCSVPPYARFSYWRDPDKTAASWKKDAFTVGDLGRLDDDGYLFLDGRRTDLIISGGVNVYPVEVEQAIAGCPGVDAAAVFGVDSERWGQQVTAAVTGTASPADVIAFARERLASYKCPKQVYVVEELPRTSTGKVQRLRLASVLGLTRAGDRE